MFFLVSVDYLTNVAVLVPASLGSYGGAIDLREMQFD